MESFTDLWNHVRAVAVVEVGQCWAALVPLAGGSDKCGTSLWMQTGGTDAE